MAAVDHRLVVFGKVTLSVGVLAVVIVLAMLHVALVPLRIAAARGAAPPSRSRAERFEELAALGMLGAFLLRLWRPATQGIEQHR